MRGGRGERPIPDSRFGPVLIAVFDFGRSTVVRVWFVRNPKVDKAAILNGTMSQSMVDVLGVGLALIAAVGIAGQTVSIRIGTEKGRSHDALVVVLLVNIVVLVPAAVFAFYPNYGLTLRSVLSFVGAGFVGTLLGRAFYYAGIEQIGASRAEPIKASQPLHSALVAVIVLGETLTTGNLFGILLIVAGVGLISREAAKNPTTATGNVPMTGLFLPLVAAFFFGIEPIFAKLGFAEGTPVLVGLAIKTLAATIGFLGYLRYRAGLPARSELLSGNVRWYVVAGVSNTVFLLAYYAALEVSPVVLVVPIMQTSPLLVVGLSFVFLQRLERVTWRLASAAAVVVAGAIAVTFAG